MPEAKGPTPEKSECYPGHSGVLPSPIQIWFHPRSSVLHGEGGRAGGTLILHSSARHLAGLAVVLTDILVAPASKHLTHSLADTHTHTHSLSLSLSLSLSVSVCLSLSLSLSLSISRSSIYLSICIYLSMHLSTYLRI